MDRVDRVIWRNVFASSMADTVGAPCGTGNAESSYARPRAWAASARRFFQPHSFRIVVWLLVLSYLVVASILSVAIVARHEMQNTDFFTFWAAGNLVGNGESPYNETAWRAIHQEKSSYFPNAAFLYPLPVAVMFVPLAKLSVAQASVIWLVAIQGLFLAAFALTARALNWQRALLYLPFFLLGMSVFRPLLITLVNGQISSFMLFATAASMYFWSRGRWFWGGVFIGLLMLKPTTAVVFLPSLILWLLWRREWRGLLGMFLATLVLWGIGALVQPDWLMVWIGIGQAKVAGTLTTAYPPTIWGWAMLWSRLGSGGSVLAWGATLSVMALGLWLTARSSFSTQWLLLFGVVMPGAVMVSPYLWNYDQVVLAIPILVLAAIMDRANVPFWVVALIPLAAGLVALALVGLALSVGHDAWGWLLPMTVGVGFASAFSLGRVGK